MSERFICDCGQIYTERAAVRECQAARHSAAAGCELADAEEFVRRAGLACPECGGVSDCVCPGLSESEDLHRQTRYEP